MPNMLPKKRRTRRRVTMCAGAACLVPLLACGATPSADQLQASTIIVSRSNGSIPRGHFADWIELRPDGAGRRGRIDGYPAAPPAPRPFAVPAPCRARVVAAILDNRLDSVRQDRPRVGGGDTTIAAQGPGLAFQVSRAAAPDDSWPAIEAVADAAFACASAPSAQ